MWAKPVKSSVTLKPNVELVLAKIPQHLSEKLKKLLTQRKGADIIRQMGCNDEMRSQFVNPITLMPKNDFF